MYLVGWKRVKVTTNLYHLWIFMHFWWVFLFSTVQPIIHFNANAHIKKRNTKGNIEMFRCPICNKRDIKLKFTYARKPKLRSYTHTEEGWLKGELSNSVTNDIWWWLHYLNSHIRFYFLFFPILHKMLQIFNIYITTNKTFTKMHKIVVLLLLLLLLGKNNRVSS